MILWSANRQDDYRNGGGATWTATWNPDNNQMSEFRVQTNHDMFCPGTALLDDGRVMITGGSNAGRTTFYNFRNNQWSIGPALKITRGYHAMTVMGNGDVFTLGGSWSGGRGGKIGELWSKSSNTWRTLTGVNDDPFLTNDKGGVYRSDNHMWLFLTPNGRIFHAGPSRRMHWITTSGSGSYTQSVLRGDNDAMNGNALMYDTGKILVVGGAPHYASGNGSNHTYVIDVRGNEAVVTPSGDMAARRTLANSVILPTGECIVIGGVEASVLFSDKGSVFFAEIWNPSTGQWTKLASMKVPRNYHSTALLLRDGRVMAAGGGLYGGCNANHQDLEVLTPPYLFNSNGQLATRPVIQFSPGTI